MINQIRDFCTEGYKERFFLDKEGFFLTFERTFAGLIWKKLKKL